MNNRILFVINCKTGQYNITDLYDKDAESKIIQVYSYTGKPDSVMVDITLPDVDIDSSKVRREHETINMVNHIVSSYKNELSKVHGVKRQYDGLAEWVSNNYVSYLV